MELECSGSHGIDVEHKIGEVSESVGGCKECVE